jgi:hypothetical protein
MVWPQLLGKDQWTSTCTKSHRTGIYRVVISTRPTTAFGASIKGVGCWLRPVRLSVEKWKLMFHDLESGQLQLTSA